MYSQKPVAPLITGSFENIETAMHDPPTFINPSGCFYVAVSTTQDRMYTTESTQWRREILYFNSSRNSSIYTGTLLRPLSSTCAFLIRY